MPWEIYNNIIRYAQGSEVLFGVSVEPATTMQNQFATIMSFLQR
jgi:hypothetical protein